MQYGFTMRHKVVLDCDWSVIEGTLCLRKLAYAAPSLGRFGEFKFTVPYCCNQFRKDPQRQARHCGGLVWSAGTPGSYYSDLIPQNFASLFDELGYRPVSLCFYAKGLQRCRLLERWLPQVTNLENLGCPKYQNLTSLKKTTLLKAVTFALWVHSCE